MDPHGLAETLVIMPDAETILAFIDQVLTGPVQIAGAFVAAFFVVLFILYLLKEMLENVRSRYWN
jgi:hypothetical protein